MPTSMKSETVATTRTGWYLGFMSAVVYLVTKFTDIELKPDDLLPYLGIFVAVGTAFYRLALYLSKKHEWIGVLFFGLSANPSYTPPVEPLGDVTVAPAETE